LDEKLRAILISLTERLSAGPFTLASHQNMVRDFISTCDSSNASKSFEVLKYIKARTTTLVLMPTK
jgi:hypothetical protein